MKFSDIYETMSGFLEPEAQVPGVANAFDEGSICARKYADMRSAYERVCTRLGARDEDRDLNEIVDCMEAIQRELCERMYRLGMEHGK